MERHRAPLSPPGSGSHRRLDEAHRDVDEAGRVPTTEAVCVVEVSRSRDGPHDLPATRTHLGERALEYESGRAVHGQPADRRSVYDPAQIGRRGYGARVQAPQL